MVAAAFILIVTVLLAPIVLLMVAIDYFTIWHRPEAQARRGFEVIVPAEKP